MNHTKNRTLVTCALSHISKMAYFYTRAQCMLLFLFSTGGKFRPVSIVSCSYSSHLFLCAVAYTVEKNGGLLKSGKKWPKNKPISYKYSPIKKFKADIDFSTCHVDEVVEKYALYRYSSCILCLFVLIFRWMSSSLPPLSSS